MKLLLADDHTLFRDALSQYLERAEPGAEIIRARDLHEVFSTLKSMEGGAPDLILLDLRMPGMSGLEGFRRLREQYPAIPIALMSGIAEPDDVRQAMALGAVGYFPKTLSGRALVKAIQLVLTGEKYLPVDPESNSLMPSYYSNGNRAQSPTVAGVPERMQMTPREQEVLTYLVQGHTNKDIARALDLQVVTIKLHVRGICRKLGAANRTQAALRARELGLVS